MFRSGGVTYPAGGCQFKPRTEGTCQGRGKSVGVGTRELKLRNEMASPREDVQRGKEMAGEMTLEITQSAEQVRERERAGRGGENAKEKLPGGQVLSGAAKASGTMCLPWDLKVIRSFVNRFITAWIS